MADNKKIFREKNLQKVNSPEALNEYIRVANPGIWLLIVGVLAFLFGVLAWCIFGKIETKVKAGVLINDQAQATFYIKEEDYSKIEKGQILRIDDVNYEVLTISNQPFVVDDNFDNYLQHVLEVEEDDWLYSGTFAAKELTPGVYAADIVIETLNPIKFILN